MVERKGNPARGEEGDQLVDMGELGAPARGDHRQAGRSDFLQQRPVANVRAGDLEDFDPELDAFVDRRFVERRDHGYHAGIAHRLDHRPKLVPTHLRVDRLFDVAHVGAAAMVAMDEAVDVAELQLDRRVDVVEADHPPEIADDLQPALELAPMVVRQLEYEQVAENRVLHSTVSFGATLVAPRRSVHLSCLRKVVMASAA